LREIRLSLPYRPESYRVLILPQTVYLQKATARKIEEFARTGGVVVIVGAAPKWSVEDGRDDPEVGEIFSKSVAESGARTVADTDGLPEVLGGVLPRDFSPEIRCLHRVIGSLHVYFVLPDDRAPKKVSFAAHGRPEIWDPYTGEAHPIEEYTISANGTEAQLDFDLSPAYFVVIDPANVRETEPPASEEDRKEISLDGEWSFRVWPTMDNTWGDFRLPARPGFMPVETREFRYAEDPADEGLEGGWRKADFDDSKWGRAVYTYGSYWAVSDAIQLAGPEEFDKPQGPEAWSPSARDWHPVVFSRAFGIEKDPIYASTLGPKSRIPAEFADLGSNSLWSVRYLCTFAYSPKPQKANLSIGCPFAKRIWVNGKLVLDQPPGSPIVSSASVQLGKGWNTILVKLMQSDSGRMRVSFALAGGETASGLAGWIWDADRERDIVYFRKPLDLPEEPKSARAYITADNGYELYVNGRLIGRELGFETSFWEEAENYALPLRKGRNVIAVKATNLGGPGGLLAWGTIELASGRKISLATDETWLMSTSPGSDWQSPKAAGAWVPPTMAGTIDSSTWGMIRWGVDPGEQAAGPRMPNRDLPGIRYDPNPDQASVAWYRFKLPPGMKALRLSMLVPTEVYVNGVRQDVRKGGLVTLKSPVSGGVCAIRARQKPGFRAGAVFAGPVQFECGPGKITLGSWHEKGLPHYSGIGVYRKTFNASKQLVGKSVALDLGNVRGTAEARINGKPVGVRIWHPYRFDISGLLRAGQNEIEVVVANTLGPHFKVGPPTPYVYPGQEVSGIMGPVSLIAETAPGRG
jgi:hypothetical protein